MLTYVHIVFGEMIPKTLAVQHAVQTALWINTPMRLFQRLWWPLVVGLEALGNGLLRLFGVRRVVRVPTPEELRSIVEESDAEGQLGQTGHMLRELFELSERRVSEVMTPRVRVVGVAQGASAVELRRLPRSARHTRYPVYEGTLDRIVGMVTIRDLLELMLADKPLSQDTVRPVPFVPATARLEKVLTTMREQDVQLVVVMDEHGGTAGIVTMEDVALEVVGPAAKGPGGAKPIYHEGTELRAIGLARLDEVGEQLGVELDHPDVDSVSGLVLALLDRPALVGDSVTYRGVRFSVLSVQGHGVKECTVEAPEGWVAESVRPHGA
jgi:CBS domain containing-hemolysin-like protein